VYRHVEEEASLRDLAGYVNDQIVEAALDAHDVELVAGLEEIRHVIAGDAADESTLSVREREKIATRLDHSGVNREALASDLVSHEVVRTHLRNDLDVDTSRDPTPSNVEDIRDMIDSIRERDTSIVERALYALQRDDRIEKGPLRASLVIRVTCKECGRTYSVGELLDSGGCRCDESGNT
jgi:hypothetical protein